MLCAGDGWTIRKWSRQSGWQKIRNVLRKILAENHWVAFVANGSVLPRKSGVSELPMTGSVPFTVTGFNDRDVIELPHRGKVTVIWLIPEGITLIVGGGYHGKSTLLGGICRTVCMIISAVTAGNW